MAKPTIPDVVARFAAYGTLHPAWGSLHIVLDDGNVGDRSVAFCLQWAEEHGDTEGAALAEILALMSKSQRGRLDWKVHKWLEKGKRGAPWT